MPRRTRNPKCKPSRRLPKAIVIEARAAGLMPLDYMLSVMRDPDADPARRDKLAICAAPYLHRRAAAYRKGKKDHAVEAAGKAGAGTAWEDDLDYSDGRLPQ